MIFSRYFAVALTIWAIVVVSLSASSARAARVSMTAVPVDWGCSA